MNQASNKVGQTQFPSFLKMLSKVGSPQYLPGYQLATVKDHSCPCALK